MTDLILRFSGEDVSRARLAFLLEHFSELSDDREPQRIMYPLDEMLLGKRSFTPGSRPAALCLMNSSPRWW